MTGGSGFGATVAVGPEWCTGAGPLFAVTPLTAPWGGGAGVSTTAGDCSMVGSGVVSSVKPHGGSPPGSCDAAGQGLPLLPLPWFPLSAEALPTASANDTIAASAISA